MLTIIEETIKQSIPKESLIEATIEWNMRCQYYEVLIIFADDNGDQIRCQIVFTKPDIKDFIKCLDSLKDKVTFGKPKKEPKVYFMRYILGNIFYYGDYND